jgi:hypothetical protein
MDHENEYDDAALLAQIGDAENLIRTSRGKIPGYFLARTGVRVAILFAVVVCMYLTFYLPPDTYAQSLLSNGASGLLVFLAAAPTLRAMRARPWITLAVGGIVAGAVLVAAFLTRTVTQSLLLNVGVGVVLLLALDLNIARWLDAVSNAEGRVRQQLAEAADKIKRAQSSLDYKYAVHDYLNLPRPDKFGGLRLEEGETLFGAASFAEPPAT